MNTDTPLPAVEVQELRRVVASLSEALARSERRYAYLAQAMRWGVIGLVSLIVLALFASADSIGFARAQDSNGLPNATSVVEALNNINANLMTMGEVGRTLKTFTPAVKQAVMSNPEVRNYVQDYFKRNNLNPTPEEQEAYAAQAIVESVVATFVDSVVLMQRIRQDSDALRDYLTGPKDVLRGVVRQLEVMNAAMASIPTMAAQMDLMNHNMASMSYSMGSSMGRMGKWMPW